ncbi:MAG: 50S ribosome-binding protein YggL [Planctomycetota bacterium]
MRKKRRLGEFREDCFEVDFEISTSLDDDDLDSLTDAFIEMIESNGLQFGGGGHREWSGVVQGPNRVSATAADRSAVLDWLNRHPDIVTASAGALRDAWHDWS